MKVADLRQRLHDGMFKRVGNMLSGMARTGLNMTGWGSQIDGLIDNALLGLPTDTELDINSIYDIYWKVEQGISDLKFTYMYHDSDVHKPKSGSVEENMSQQIKKALMQVLLDVKDVALKYEGKIKNGKNRFLEGYKKKISDEKFNETINIFRTQLINITRQYLLNLATSDQDFRKNSDPDGLAKDYVAYCNKHDIDIEYFKDIEQGKEKFPKEFSDKLMEMHNYFKDNPVSSKSQNILDRLIYSFVQYVLRIFGQSNQNYLESKIGETPQLIDKLHRKKPQ